MPFNNILTDEDEQKKAQSDITGRLNNIDYDSILNNDRSARQTQLRGNLYNGSQFTPDQHARTQRLADDAGMDASIVQGNEDTIEKANNLNKIDYQGIVDEAPALSSFLADPKKAALVQDEVTDWHDFSNTWSDLGKSVDVGIAQTRLGNLGFRSALAQLGAGNPLSVEEQTEFSTLQIPEAPSNDRGSFTGIPFVVAEIGANLFGAAEAGFKTGVKGAAGAGGLGATGALIAGQLGPQAALPEEVITVPVAAAVAATTTFPFFFAAGSIAFGIEQEAGNAYHEFLQFRDDEGNPLDKDIAAIAGLLSGATSGSIEGIANKTLLKKLPGVEKFIGFFGKNQIKKMLAKQTGRDILKRMSKTFGKIAATEGTTEAIQEALIILGGEAAKMAGEGEFDKISADDFWNRVEESFVKGVQAGVGIGAPNIVLQGATDANRVRKANINMQKVSDRIDKILGSKLSERSEGAMQELYQSIADSKGDGDVFISPAPLFTQLQAAGIDTVGFFEDMGVTAEQLNEALQSGGDIVVKAGNILTASKNTEFKDILLANIRQDVSAMTVLEAEEYGNRIEQDTQDALNKLEADAETIQVMETQADEIFDNVAQAIGDAGIEQVGGQRFAVAEMYRGLALRQMADWAAEGKEFDVVSFYEGLGLSFVREGFPEVDTGKRVSDVQLSGLLNELRTSKAGQFEALQRTAFGPSISERARDLGINDDRGDLLSQDIDFDRAAFQRNILRDDGISLDQVGEQLLQEGFFQERPTTDELIQAIVSDLGATSRDQRGFNPSNVDETALARLTSLETLDEDLNRAGLSLDDLSNEEIIAALGNASSQTDQDGRTLFQEAGDINSEAFKNWFGDSVAVTEDGKAQVLYHGTAIDFDRFSADAKSRSGSSARGAIFLSPSPDFASAFASDNERGGGQVIPVYISIKNPAGQNLETAETIFNQAVDTSIVGSAQSLGDFYSKIDLAKQTDVSRRSTIFNEFDIKAIPKYRDSDVGSIDFSLQKFFLNARDNPKDAFDDFQTAESLSNIMKDAGFDGYIETEAGVDNFAVFEPEQVKSIFNKGAFDPNDPRIKFQKGSGEVRGGIRGDFGNFNSQFEIFVTPNQNLSTLLHETGHLFLEVLGREAALPDSPKRVKENLQAALDFLGVDKFEDIKNDQHEKWANSFEVYLREGKAPNARMQRTFNKFRAWLVKIYKRLIGLHDIEITPEVRKIFDTMLASEEEVTQTEADNVFAVNQDIVDLMTESEVEAYFATAQKAHDEGVSETLQKQMRVQQREAMKWWKSERAKTKARMTDEVWDSPLYQAWHFMAKGKFFNRDTPGELVNARVNKQKLIDTFNTSGILQDMPNTVPKMWKIKGGLHPDELAEMVGYASGFELFEDIINAERPIDRIERLTDEEMQRNNPVPDISEDATEAVFNDERALFLANELKAIRRNAGDEFQNTVLGRAARSPLTVIKAAVKRVIDKKPIREITKPFVYLNNSQRAAKEKLQAIADGDMQKAAQATAKQLFNFLMFRESLNVKEKSQKIQKRLSKVANKPLDDRKIAPDYITAMKDIATAFLNPDNPNSTLTLRGAVEWAKGQENDPDNPANLVIPSMFEGDFSAISLKDMTFRDLTAVDNMIKSLREEGRRRGDEVAEEFKQRDISLAASVDKNVKRTAKSPIGKPGSRQAIEDGFAQYLNAHVKATQFFREMDGFEEQGEVWSTFMGKASEMEDAETLLLEEKLPALRDIFKKYFTRADLAKSMWRKVHLGEFGALSTVTKQQLLSLALNFGNQENIDAIANGYNVKADDLFAAMDEHLTENDWLFVQETWDFIDGFWPNIQELEQRVTGVSPRKVEASKVNSKHGTFKGGYYPLKYDQRQSSRANENLSQQKFTLMTSGRISRATTSHGHTKERVGSDGQPVKLDLDVVFQHVNNVIHDLSYREGIMDLNRLLNGRQFTDAVVSTFGADVHRNLKNWLTDIGAGNIEPVGVLDKLLRRVRVGTTIVTMGFSFSTMAVQILGYGSSLARLGTAQTIRGTAQFFKNPRAGWKFVFSNSPFMRKRFSNFDRDVNAFASSITRAGVTEEIAQMAFKGIGFMDLMVSMPTWIGAYEQGMNLFDGDHKKSSRHADAVVQESQGSGSAKDLAGIMRGSQGSRLLTMFMSYFSAMHNLLRENTVQLRNGGISPARFTLHMLYLVILPPIIEGLMRGEEPEDDDEWAQWAGKKVGGYSFSTLVGVRDVANLWTTDYGFGFSPVAQTLKTGFEGTKGLVTSEDPTDYNVRQAVSLFGVLTKTPTKKVYDQFDYWMKVLDGEEKLTPEGAIFNKRER